jgi:hypothetical protein
MEYKDADIRVPKTVMEAWQKPRDALTLRERTAAVFMNVGTLDYRDVMLTIRSMYPMSPSGADAARKVTHRAFGDAFPGAMPPETPKWFYRQDPLKVSTDFQTGQPVGPLPAGAYMGTLMVGSYDSAYRYLRGDKPFRIRPGSLG